MVYKLYQSWTVFYYYSGSEGFVPLKLFGSGLVTVFSLSAFGVGSLPSFEISFYYLSDSAPFVFRNVRVLLVFILDGSFISKSGYAECFSLLVIFIVVSLS